MIRPEPAASPRPTLVGRAALAAFLVALVLGLLLGLGVRPLEFEEPRRALVALEMGLRGDLVVPTTNGALYLNKPPLFAWLLLGLMRLNGAGEAWLRLPTVLSFLLAGAALAAAARPLGRTTALLAPVLFFTFGDLLFYGTLHADIDLFFTLLVTLQALAIFGLEQRGRPLALFAVSYLLAAIAFLTKSYPALAFQALTLVAWLVAARRARWLFSWQHLAGLAVFLALAGGYFLLYAQRADAGRYLLRLLLDSSERTVVASRHGAGALVVQLVTFPLTLAKGCLPWSLFAGLLFLPAFRARVRAEPLLRFAAIFVAANALPYWLSPGTRPRYLFPLLPFVALLLAAALPHLAERGVYARAARWALGIALALGAAAALALPLVPPAWRLVEHPWAWFPGAVALAGAAVAFWRARTLPGRVLALALALALGRVEYDLVVPALRRERSGATFLREVADDLYRDHRGARIFLAGAEKVEERRIPLLGGTASFPQREWFPTELSFYYSARRGELLEYATAPRPGDLLLAHVPFDVGHPHDVLRIWKAAREDHDLKLVRVRE